MELTINKRFLNLSPSDLLEIDGGGWLNTTLFVVGSVAAVVGLGMAVAACPAVAIVAAPTLKYSLTAAGLSLGGSLLAGGASLSM